MSLRWRSLSYNNMMSKHATLCLQEWRSVIQEVTNFLHADVAMPVPRSPGSNVPFRHSLRAALNQAEVKSSPHKMLLHDAILVSYYTRQVRGGGVQDTAAVHWSQGCSSCTGSCLVRK
jgi:predicted RNase H-like nuclease